MEGVICTYQATVTTCNLCSDVDDNDGTLRHV